MDLPEGKTSGECPYCGCLTTYPKVADPHREQLYNRAEHFRRLNDFDKAVDAYEALVREDDSDPEAYWGLVLSRFGIEYVEDPASHERIPTCHRVQFESILADPDYQSVLEKSSGTERDIYEKEAQRIAEIQKGILAISAQEKPFDVFICYKEATDGGTRTKDSVIAQDIYYQLVNSGYKVFFARITLEDKLGQQYEPYIFAALNSAKVMLVIGTKKEYFEAVWVRNEWSRFLALMKKDRKKLLIPCYKDMDAYDIPQELSLLQSQDMSKIGFIQDLIRGVKKVVDPAASAPKVNPVAAPAAAPAPANAATAPLVKRIGIFLFQKDWASASKYCERVLDMDPEIAQVYIYKIMAKYQLTREEDLQKINGLEQDADFQLAMDFFDAAGRQRLSGILREQAERKRREEEAEAKRLKILSSGVIVFDLPGNVELAMVKIKAGSFLMGSPENENGSFPDETQHRVTLTQDYWLGKYSVTQGQWQAVMNNNPSAFKKGDNYPVESVSWNDARNFCIKLNELCANKLPPGYRFDLPTEAQWEYACRAGTTSAFNNGKDLTWLQTYITGAAPVKEVGWFDENSAGSTHEVGKKLPNAWGLSDMHGNVWEWCRDWYGPYDGDATDPTGPASGSYRVGRGGGWYRDDRRCRSASRSGGDPGYRVSDLGFRLALVPVQ